MNLRALLNQGSERPMDTRHSLANFDAALDTLRADLFMMASLTERGLERASRGLLERDTGLCNNVIADDEEIDLLEIQIDRAGIEVILRYQPVASDLRQVVSSMKISTNLERVADQSVTIARRARKLNQESRTDDIHHLDAMFATARGMLQDAIKSYAEGNLTIAGEMKPRDRELDAMNLSVTNFYTECMQKHPSEVANYLNLIFIARALERVGDHAVNIGEDAIYAHSAQDIRHPKARSEEA